MSDMDRQFSRGNLWSIITTIVAVVGMGGTVLVTQTRTNSNVEENTRNISALQSREAANSSAIQSLQVSSARTSAQYEAISRSVAEVRDELREIANMLRDEGRNR